MVKLYGTSIRVGLRDVFCLLIRYLIMSEKHMKLSSQVIQSEALV